MRPRYQEIDIMRGLAIIAMIGIHTAAYFPETPTIYALWDTLEFAVPIFIFCSAYLFFKQEYHHTISHSLGYYKKRIIRLLFPYYAFLALYMPVVYFVQPKKVTQTFLIDNIFLTGGIDFNWLVLLFLLLSFLMPILMYLLRKKKTVFYLYVALAAASSVLFLFWRPYEWYRWIMVIPWSLLIVFSWWVAAKEQEEGNMAKLFVISAVVFFAARAILVFQRAPIDHFNNKYPPNIFHLSYGFISIIGLYYLSHMLKRTHGIVRGFISFFSKYSYSIYFIHIAVIYAIADVAKTDIHKLGFPLYFLYVLSGTAIIQLLFSLLQRARKR